MKKTFSENIIFFDTEFTSLDAEVGELISLGLVKYTGEELYLEVEYTREPHPWVVEHVLPYLTHKKVSREEACRQLTEFLGSSGGEGKPYLLAYVNQFDAIYWYKLFQSAQEHPAFWIPLDFASILFAEGRDPGSMSQEAFFSELGIDKTLYQDHNALSDARLLRDVYLKMQQL